MGEARAKAQRVIIFWCVAPYSVIVCIEKMQRGPARAEPMVRGLGRQKPPEAKTLLTLGRAMETANLPAF